jgi:hypothetical protein
VKRASNASVRSAVRAHGRNSRGPHGPHDLGWCPIHEIVRAPMDDTIGKDPPRS